jgi:hypothetical protein
MTSVNPNYFSRFGNVNDLVYLEKLLIETKEYKKNSSKSWSYPFDDKEFDISAFMKIAENIILDEKHAKNKIVLVFDQEENIKCVSIAMFWTMIKSWRQGIILCQPNNLYFNAVNNGIADASTSLISYAESIGYYSYDFVVANPRNDLRWNRMRKQIPIINDRYEFFDEAIIPANTMPAHPRYQRMMRNRTWNVDLLYRIGYLKNQYRKKDLLAAL